MTMRTCEYRYWARKRDERRIRYIKREAWA